ncbi:MAG TPA: PAS domain S-box protein, partial [Arenimonas sp.]|nr:PAS domain S-box protein [Arenimonas sp.]
MNENMLRVLVVDDDEEDFLILRDLLADYPQGHFQLEWVATLAEGVKALRANEHDVFLVDYHLGPDNGMDLVRMAVSEGSSHRPVIMLTGQGNPDVDREALSAGASDYLIKGNIDAEKLARSLRYAAERARQLAQIEDGKRRYRQLFELNPFPTWVYEVASHQFVAVNDAMVANYGYTRDELLGMRIFDIRDPEETTRLKDFLAQRGEQSGSAGVWRHRRKDGSLVWAEVTGHPIELDGKRCRMVIAHDISEHRSTQERMLLLQRAVESSMNGIVIADAQAGDLPIIYVNPAFESLTGYSAEEALGRNCRFLQGEETRQPELNILRRSLSEGRESNVILRNFRKDGQPFWNHLFISPVRDEHGAITHFVGIQNDLTERRQVEAELAYAANHDAVTSLPRYPILETAINTLLERGGVELSVLFIDIDHFHAINESMG